MSSWELYKRIYDSHRDHMRSGDIDIDPHLLWKTRDSRMGISLIISLHAFAAEYANIVESFRTIEPDQYYYPFDDLHITIFDFIQGTHQYRQNAALEHDFLDISQEALASIPPFSIHMKGIVFSKAAGLIKGYDENRLIEIREKIRRIMKARKKDNDERYRSESAHVTWTRFTRKIQKPREYCHMIDAHTETEIGEEVVREIELVEHDWYNSLEKKRIIGVIPLAEAFNSSSLQAEARHGFGLNR